MAANDSTRHSAATATDAAPAPSGAAPPAGKVLSAYDLVIGILAILSLVILALLIFAPLSADTKDVLNVLENGLCAVFLFDFFRSLFRAQHKWGYFLRGGGWLDLLGSIPFSGFAVFRFFRLFRIIRVVRTLRGNELRDLLLDRIAESVLLFTLVSVLTLIFAIAGIVAWAEHGAPNANIESYREAVWWGVVTITTVGYGDYYPVTAVGRLSAAILMFAGLGIIGVLSSYLATTYLSLQTRRAARRGAGAPAHASTSNTDEATANGDGTAAGTEAELAAIKEELGALRRLLEERSLTPEPPA